MAEIRSALEIALEKTASIKSDPHAGKNRDLQNTGKKLASSFLDSGDGEVFTSELKKYDSKTVNEGVYSYLYAQFQLPEKKEQMERIQRVCNGFTILFQNNELTPLFEQLFIFFNQYFEDKEQVHTMLEQQFIHKLQAKQQELSRMYGQEIELRPEQDPEFNQHLNRNLEALKAQYEGAIDQARQHVSELMQQM